MENVELHDDGGKFGIVQLQPDLFHGHDDTSRPGSGCCA